MEALAWPLPDPPLAIPFATTPFGRDTVGWPLLTELVVGYLLVCGRGLESLAPLLTEPSLWCKLGVLRLVLRSWPFLRFVVVSMNQCDKFFQWAMMA